MQFISALTTGVRNVRNAMLPQTVLQDAVSSLHEVLMLLDSQSGKIPTATLQKHQATYNRLNQQAQELAVNNSLNEAKALRKEAEQFKDEVRQQCDSLRLEALEQLA